MSFRARVGTLLLLAALAIAAALLSPRIPQDPAYHAFADQRPLFTVPHFWNVASNLPFVLVGLFGLWAVRKAQWIHPADRYPWIVIACSAVLIGFGSAYYHYAPGNRTLFWDRLPMTLAFMGVFTAAISEFIHARVGALLLAPFLCLGMLSVEVWRRGELTGVGDLRFYILVQFYPMLALPLTLLLFRSRYSHVRAMWGMAALYAAAKLLELLDAPLLSATGGLISGHSLKHLAGAAALAVAFRAVAHRTPVVAR
ncbi:MAG: ceramidase domain-containing protein [Bryobacterales bacterium]|nr:ceramidase domain-containing protein [Bryobacterales bacterium]